VGVAVAVAAETRTTANIVVFVLVEPPAAATVAVALFWQQQHRLPRNRCWRSPAIPSRHRLPKNIPGYFEFVAAVVGWRWRLPFVVTVSVVVAHTLVVLGSYYFCRLPRPVVPAPVVVVDDIVVDDVIVVVVVLPLVSAATPKPPVPSSRRHSVVVVVSPLLPRPMVMMLVSFPYPPPLMLPWLLTMAIVLLRPAALEVVDVDVEIDRVPWG